MRADRRWHGVPVVRRPTGGGAIWHDRELTYAIAVPPGFPLGRPSTALYRAVHRAIAAELAGRGLAAHRRGEAVEPHRSGPDRPFLCFTDRDPDDIVSNDQKVVGSAQRRRGGAVLQHGSVLLAQSPGTPEFPGISDLARLPDGPHQWEGAFLQRIAVALGLRAVPIGWPASLRERSRALEASRYRSPAWTEAR
jgi:lipoate-protein ligase A